MESKIEKAKVAFGARLREFRIIARLSQRDLAILVNTGNAYISDLETGIANPTFDILIRYAAFFGVEHYELSNPKFPLPTFEQLPASTRKAISKLKKQQQAIKIKAEEMKAANKEEGVPGRAKRLHALIATGFFKKPKTAKDAFVKLNTRIPKKELSEHSEEISKITVTLSSGKFPKLLDKLEPAPGTLAVRFVEKTPGVVPFPQEKGGVDLAADEDT